MASSVVTIKIEESTLQLLLRKSLYKTFGKSFIKSASRKYASQKTGAKRKKWRKPRGRGKKKF